MECFMHCIMGGVFSGETTDGDGFVMQRREPEDERSPSRERP